MRVANALSGAMLGEGGGRRGAINFVDRVLEAVSFAGGELLGLRGVVTTELIGFRFLQDSRDGRFFNTAAPSNDGRNFQLLSVAE